MVFSSVTFLFLFLPITVILHASLPNVRLKNACLIFASLLFYAWGEGLYVVLMLVSVLANWLFSLLLVKFPKGEKFWVTAAVVGNMGLLIGYKYLGFFAELANRILPLHLPVPNIHLPIGISFFTFQALSYVIDVKRDRTLFQKNFFRVLLYIVLFPQLIAGPIVKYHSVSEQLSSRRVTAEQTARGIRRFIVGLAKKLLLADRVAVIADALFSGEALSCAGAWTGIVCYLLQIYLDFCGYSDMAIGLGMMFGFRFEENFNFPFVSKNISEFWRRWHISLSTWFREYLYIPLGGNRKGLFRTCLNLMIVFTATGLWHGANLTFLVWGLWNGVLIVMERLLPDKKPHPVLGRIYTLFSTAIGFVFFRSDSLGTAARYLCAMFGIGTVSNYAFLRYFSPLMLITLFAAILACVPVYPAIKRKIRAGGAAVAKVSAALSYPFAILLFVLCAAVLASNSYSPFIYFRF